MLKIGIRLSYNQSRFVKGYPEQAPALFRFTGQPIPLKPGITLIQRKRIGEVFIYRAELPITINIFRIRIAGVPGVAVTLRPIDAIIADAVIKTGQSAALGFVPVIIRITAGAEYAVNPGIFTIVQQTVIVFVFSVEVSITWLAPIIESIHVPIFGNTTDIHIHGYIGAVHPDFDELGLLLIGKADRRAHKTGPA